jgi:hypothetical protein
MTWHGVTTAVVRTTVMAMAWGGASASCTRGVAAADASHLNYREGSLV